MDEPILLHYITNKDNQSSIVYPATVGQCTGLVAAKSYRGGSEEDRLIFEGDILRVRWQNKEYIGKVYWDETQWFGAEDYLSVAVGHGAEIIGTVYENPELLERSAGE